MSLDRQLTLPQSTSLFVLCSLPSLLASYARNHGIAPSDTKVLQAQVAKTVTISTGKKLAFYLLCAVTFGLYYVISYLAVLSQLSNDKFFLCVFFTAFISMNKLPTGCAEIFNQEEYRCCNAAACAKVGITDKRDLEVVASVLSHTHNSSNLTPFLVTNTQSTGNPKNAQRKQQRIAIAATRGNSDANRTSAHNSSYISSADLDMPHANLVYVSEYPEDGTKLVPPWAQPSMLVADTLLEFLCAEATHYSRSVDDTHLVRKDIDKLAIKIRKIRQTIDACVKSMAGGFHFFLKSPTTQSDLTPSLEFPNDLQLTYQEGQSRCSEQPMDDVRKLIGKLFGSGVVPQCFIDCARLNARESSKIFNSNGEFSRELVLLSALIPHFNTFFAEYAAKFGCKPIPADAAHGKIDVAFDDLYAFLRKQEAFKVDGPNTQEGFLSALRDLRATYEKITTDAVAAGNLGDVTERAKLNFLRSQPLKLPLPIAVCKAGAATQSAVEQEAIATQASLLNELLSVILGEENTTRPNLHGGDYISKEFQMAFLKDFREFLPPDAEEIIRKGCEEKMKTLSDSLKAAEDACQPLASIRAQLSAANKKLEKALAKWDLLVEELNDLAEEQQAINVRAKDFADRLEHIVKSSFGSVIIDRYEDMGNQFAVKIPHVRYPLGFSNLCAWSALCYFEPLCQLDGSWSLPKV